MKGNRLLFGFPNFERNRFEGAENEPGANRVIVRALRIMSERLREQGLLSVRKICLADSSEVLPVSCAVRRKSQPTGRRDSRPLLTICFPSFWRHKKLGGQSNPLGEFERSLGRVSGNSQRPRQSVLGSSQPSP